MDEKHVVIEYPSMGATYHRNEYGVYEYSEYGPSSVLAGQSRRQFLDSFETLSEAQAAYPAAHWNDNGSHYPPSANTYDHLSDGPDDLDEGDDY